MSSKSFRCVLVAAVLMIFSSCSSGATGDDYRCSYNIHVNKGQIIKAKESLGNGATFLEHSAVPNARECYMLCCELDKCDLAQMQYKNASDGLGIEKVCYMFHCGNPSKCNFGEHDHYATLSYDKPEPKLKDIAEESLQPAKKVEKPNLKGKGEKTKPSVAQGCPDGVPVASCHIDPCMQSSCPSNKEAICVPSYCGTCHSIFIDSNGAQVDCSGEGDDEETDLQLNPVQRPHQQNTKKPENWLKETPLDTETEEENKEHSEEKFKSTDPKYHQNVKKPLKNKNTLIKQKIKTNKPDILTKYFEVEKEVPTTEDHQAEEEKEDQWNRYFGDKDTELEQKLEELTPSSQHPPKFPAKLATTPEPAFHEWRQFVDNNPNFPYTIPKSAKKTTKRPTKKPSTEKHTEKSTEKVTTTVRPSIASEKPKTTETERVENNNYGHAASERPPILDHPRPHKNVSDIVVIETRRLRIIENKAVLPLAIFLVLAILLLFVVALRLRIVKSKLKRRPFATDDADYLINGMYL